MESYWQKKKKKFQNQRKNKEEFREMMKEWDQNIEKEEKAGYKEASGGKEGRTY